MALRPGIKIIDPASMPIQKMPIDKLDGVVPKSTPLGQMIDLLPDTSLTAGPPSDGSAQDVEQTVTLVGVTGTTSHDLI